MNYQDWLIRKAKEQMEVAGRIDTCLVTEMMQAGFDVPVIEQQLMKEIENGI
jgi:hypothetical protein